MSLLLNIFEQIIHSLFLLLPNMYMLFGLSRTKEEERTGERWGWGSITVD